MNRLIFLVCLAVGLSSLAACSPRAAKSPSGNVGSDAADSYARWSELYRQVVSDKQELREFNRRFITEGARPCLVDEYEQALNTAEKHLAETLAASISLASFDASLQPGFLPTMNPLSTPVRQTLAAYSELASKYSYIGQRYKREESLARARRINETIEFTEQAAGGNQ